MISIVEVNPRSSPKRLRTTHELISITRESVETSIVLIRSQRVILDQVLARFYGVSTRVLSQAVKQNPHCFPPDFMFQLTIEEAKLLVRSTKSRPYVFTEHGILMLSKVLKYERVTQVNIQIARTFIGLREVRTSNAELSRRLDVLDHTIRQLVSPKTVRRRPIGFRTGKK